MYSPKAVANYFIERVPGLTPMKLQKLVYYSHAASLAILEKPLINEPVQAWRYGPVIGSLYHEFKRFGNNPIEEPSKDYYNGGEIVPSIDANDGDTICVLNAIMQGFGSLSAIQLSNMTHEPGEAWKKTIDKFEGQELPSGVCIKDDDIKECFKNRFLEDRQ